jgi:hypothetical protein
MYGASAGPIPARQGKSAYRKVKKLIRELDDTDDEEEGPSESALAAGTSRSSSSASITAPSIASVDPKKPWLKEFNHYLNTVDKIPDSLTMVKWWGVSACCSTYLDKHLLTHSHSSSMPIAFQSGRLSQETIYPLWRRRCRASERSLQRGSQLVSAGTASKVTLWRRFSF